VERAMKRIKNGHLHLIPASEDTRGHGTTGIAKFWNHEVRDLLQTAPRRAMSDAYRVQAAIKRSVTATLL
jgi:homoserine O-acetyltransferase/O-succinyltransferase